MNIFADFHHWDLYHSLYLLFEKRLGHNLYCPIGMEWFNEGYWKIASPYGDVLETIRQFLDCPVGVIEKVEDSIYYLYEKRRNIYYKGITLDKFNTMDIDIVISSIPAHDITFAKLIRDYKPTAKHISQIGNMRTPQTHVKNVMLSAPSKVSQEQNAIHYNQEFDLSVFEYTVPVMIEKVITAFIHNLPLKDLFTKYEHALADFTFKEHGSGNKDGVLPLLADVAHTMSESTFGWMVKPNDGYGHILHNWLACGRPVITNMSNYSHHQNILIPGETCINLEANTFERNIEIIKECSEPSLHKKMCETTYKIFKENVNFERDSEKIRLFLEALK